MFTTPMPANTFERLFISQSLRQQFNRKVVEFISDETEPAVRKYLRVINN